MNYLPLWALFLATAAIVAISLEFGYRLGRWRHNQSQREKEAPVGAMVTATLGLLAFMLAFTFGMAATRFDARRQVLLDEVNAVGTTWLRAEMLPEPHGTEVRGVLREYVDARLQAARTGNLSDAIRRSEELHGRLWSETVAVAGKNSQSEVVALFIESVNNLIDLHTQRVTAVLARIPGILWLVLYAITVVGMAGMGYQAGLAGTTRSIAAIALAFTFSAVILLIADLDRPGEGSLRVSQQAMIDLQSAMRAGSRG